MYNSHRLKHILLDLDNTLYPRHSDLFTQVDKRIRDYVGRLLKVDGDEAQAGWELVFGADPNMVNEIISLDIQPPGGWLGPIGTPGGFAGSSMTASRIAHSPPA